MPVILPDYPGQIPTFTEKYDLVDIVFAEHINKLQREVAAITSTIGTQPAGQAATTVRQRIENIEASLLELSQMFDNLGHLPETAVINLPQDLAAIDASLVQLQNSINILNNEITALQSQKPAVEEVILVEGVQYVYGAKYFHALLRALSLGRYSAISTDHGWQIGEDDGIVLKFDYLGCGAYDNFGPIEMEWDREAGGIFFGGALRAAGMAGLEAVWADVLRTSSQDWVVLTGGPSITIDVTNSTRLAVTWGGECLHPNGLARIGVRVEGANTIIEEDLYSVACGLPVFTSGFRHRYHTGLLVGETTFTLVFKSVGAGQAQFQNLSLSVVPML